MEVLKKKLTLMIMLMTLLLASSAWAGPVGASNTAVRGSSANMLGPMFQTNYTNYSLNDEIRRASVFELLGTENKNCVGSDGKTAVACQWPNFPRVWYEKIEGSNFKTRIAVTADMSVNIPGIFEAGGGVEIVPYNYVYSTEISLQVIGTRTVDAANAPKVDPNAAQGDLLQAFFKPNFDDTKRPKRYFNVTPESPMVGFCTYRMALRKEFSVNTNGNVKLSFPGGVFKASGGINTSAGSDRYEQEGILLQSQFFQIRSDVPVDDYLAVKCKQQFAPTARAFVQKAFDLIVLTSLGQWLPGTQCQMTTEKYEEGDADCLSWFYTTQHPTVQHVSRPRCVVGKDQIGRCQIFAKEEMPCTMYRQRDGTISDKFSLYSEVATAYFGPSRCDEGTKCTMDKEPWMVGPLVIWQGRASCKPIH